MGEVVRLSRRGRNARLGGAAAALAALLYGTVWGTDDHFPFGPLTQYAFAADPDGTVGDLHILADTAAGERVRLSLSPQGAGIVRAEVEGQVEEFRADPARLQAVADSYHRLHPRAPRLTRLYLRVTHTRLEDGVVDRVEDVAEWGVR